MTGVLALLEPRCLDEGSDRRHDGIADATALWLEDRRFAWDATCVLPAAAINFVIATAFEFQAALSAEIDKRAKYAAIPNDCLRLGNASRRLAGLGHERCVLHNKWADASLAPPLTRGFCSTSAAGRRLSFAVQMGNASYLANLNLSNSSSRQKIKTALIGLLTWQLVGREQSYFK